MAQRAKGRIGGDVEGGYWGAADKRPDPDGIDEVVKNMRPVYKPRCCIQCGRKVHDAQRLEPLFCNAADEPVYLHPKCTEAFEASDEQYFACNPPAKYERSGKITRDNTARKEIKRDTEGRLLGTTRRSSR